MFRRFGYSLITASAMIGDVLIIFMGSRFGETLMTGVFGEVGLAVDCFGERFGCSGEGFPVNVAKSGVVKMKSLL